MFAHYPRLAAWVVLLAFIGVGTIGGVLGLRALEPAVPANLAHVHGVVVAVRTNGTFAVQTPEYNSPLWFAIAPGAPISLDHLRRHQREHAATDVYYQLHNRQRGAFLAWKAD
ncbi:MAG TPA: hypothetical protein VKT82_34625 [Ktedonobacterales bacterium]|nr:hypothetical protein [Ktedonobacterales bacterium]